MLNYDTICITSPPPPPAATASVLGDFFNAGSLDYSGGQVCPEKYFGKYRSTFEQNAAKERGQSF